MDSTQPPARTQRGLVLVADGFDEPATICCVRTFRDAGLAIALVGLPGGPVTGNRGITLHPDMSLDRALQEDTATLIVIPGGRRSAMALLTDPRVHHLMQATAASGGKVAVLGRAVEGAERLLRVPWIRQGTLTVHQLIAELLV